MERELGPSSLTMTERVHLASDQGRNYPVARSANGQIGREADEGAAAHITLNPTWACATLT